MSRPHANPPLEHYSLRIPPAHLARLREIAGENVQVASLIRLAIKRFLTEFATNPTLSIIGIEVTPPSGGGAEEADDVPPHLP